MLKNHERQGSVVVPLRKHRFFGSAQDDEARDEKRLVGPELCIGNGLVVVVVDLRHIIGGWTFGCFDEWKCTKLLIGGRNFCFDEWEWTKLLIGGRTFCFDEWKWTKLLIG